MSASDEPVAATEESSEATSSVAVESTSTEPVYVLGLDFGTTTLVGSLAQYGVASEYPILVRNSTSELSTDAVICYAESERLIGGTAVSHLVTQPDDTIDGVKGVLDTTVEPLPVAYRIVEEEGIRGVQPRYRGGERTFVPLEQVIAGLVRRIHQYTLHDSLLWQRSAAPQNIEQIVVSVPNQSSEQFRKSIVDACAIAGMRVVELIEDGTAAALCYATSRPVPPGVTETLLFCNMGAAFTSITLAQTTTNDVKILRSVGARLGGRDFDQALFQHLAAECASKFRIDVASNKKASAKLLRAIQQAKTVLSTGTSATIELESLMDDTDVTLPFTRPLFVQVCGALIERFQQLVRTALVNDADANASPNANVKVELLGSALILPILQEALLQAAGATELHRHLDPATSVATGAGIAGALGGLRTTSEGLLALPPNRYSEEAKSAEASADAAPTTTAAAEPPTFEGRLSAEQIARLIEVERGFERNDEEVQVLSNLRNSFEQWIYRTRDQLKQAAAADQDVKNQQAEVTTALAEVEEWLLYGEEAETLAANDLQTAIDARKASFASSFVAFHGWQVKQEEEKRRQEAEYAEAIKNGVPRAARDKLANPRTNKERIKAASQRKDQGNTAFANVDYKTALMRYTQGIEVLVELAGEVTPEQREEADKLLLLCNLNSAACSLKFKGDSAVSKAIATAKRALEINGPTHRFGQAHSVKAHHRKASAHIQAKQYEEAKVDLAAAIKLDENNQPLKDMLANVEKTIVRLEAERQQMFQRMFE